MEKLKDELANLAIDCSDAELIDFKKWVLQRLWKEYNDDCMNKRIIAENKINALEITIPNATVGEEYKAEISIPHSVAQVTHAGGLEDCGLTITPLEAGRYGISGIPSKDGQFNIHVEYRYDGWVEGRPLLERNVPLFINPDPRSLWKNIPTDPNIEYYQVDQECDYVKVLEKDGKPQKDIVVASQRGRSHAHEGKPRDDHYRAKYIDQSGWYVMAVADGAGSAEYSRKGSTIACDTAVAHCESFFEDTTNVANLEEYITAYAGTEGTSRQDEQEYRKLLGDEIYKLVGNAALKAHRAIAEEAVQKNVDIKKYSTTLLLAVCKQFDFGWFVGSFWVGDGAMAIYDKDRHYVRLLGTPDGGEYAGQTRFLTMPEIFRDGASFYSRLRFSIEKGFTALMLMTDGVSDPMFETDANLQRIEKWDAFWDNLTQSVELTDDNEQSKDQLLAWLDFWSKGNHDDRTIAILY